MRKIRPASHFSIIFHQPVIGCITLILLLSTYFSAKTAELPSDAAYVIVNDKGQLSVNGQRQRYWAAIGKLLVQAGIKKEDTEQERAQKIERSRKGTDVILDHLERMGFNSVRMWNTVQNGENYQVGDGSSADCVDYFVAQAGKRGFRIWAAGVGNSTGLPSPEDVGIVNDPGTAEEWKAAISETLSGSKKLDLRHNIARAWDPRLEALVIERMRRNAQHMNKHTGLRWADDPTFAVWELTNEEWWMRKMVGGQWRQLPSFFRNQLLSRWNAFLLQKYKSDEALTKAWDKLLPGESLAKSSVLFVPMAGKTKAAISLNDANEQARASVTALESEYSRADFSRQRGADVLEFLVELQLGHKQRLAAAFKSFGKSTKLSPLLYDTGIGYEIQSQYMHQNADAVSHDAYVNGWGPEYKTPDLSATPSFPHEHMLKQLDAERLSANVGLWNNWLLKPPGISQGVPWLEHNRTAGKPYVVYETQIQQPAKYRADFPLRLAALASIQDWDWISWHYFSPADDTGIVKKPFERALDVTSGQHPQGYHFTYDEVQNAMMRAAAYMFRTQSLAPAPNPTRFIFGRKSLFDPDSMDYAGSYGKSGMDMFQTTYQYGVRIEIDPKREDDEVIGPVISFDQRLTHNPYTPTDAIVFDWKKGFLTMDVPSAMAYTGSIAKQGNSHDFKSGVSIQNVTVRNPEGIADPITPDENYIAFAVYSRDGLPLNQSKKASLSLVSTSFNSGFKLGQEMESPYKVPKGTKPGGLPVLVARVGATIKAPALEGMAYEMRDWNNQVIGSGVVKNGTLIFPEDQPVFSIELSR